jgi:hypothetical protein
MATTYSKPRVSVVPNPINLDAEILKLQNALSSLPWLEKIFGRARKAISNGSRKNLTFPECYEARGEYVNVLPNDHLKAYSFFTVEEDKGEFLEYQAFQKGNKQKVGINIIFWWNLKKVDPAKDYIFTEELKAQILDALRNESNLVLQEFFEDPDDVFAGFTLEKPFDQTFKFPFGGLRLKGDLFFTENCGN